MAHCSLVEQRALASIVRDLASEGWAQRARVACSSSTGHRSARRRSPGRRTPRRGRRPAAGRPAAGRRSAHRASPRPRRPHPARCRQGGRCRASRSAPSRGPTTATSRGPSSIASATASPQPANRGACSASPAYTAERGLGRVAVRPSTGERGVGQQRVHLRPTARRGGVVGRVRGGLATSASASSAVSKKPPRPSPNCSSTVSSSDPAPGPASTASPVAASSDRKPSATSAWSSSTPAWRPATPSRDTRSSRPLSPSTRCTLEQQVRRRRGPRRRQSGRRAVHPARRAR